VIDWCPEHELRVEDCAQSPHTENASGNAITRSDAAASDDEPRVIPAPNKPMAVARKFVEERFTHADGALLLRHWRGGWWWWQTSHWTELEDRAVRAEAYQFTEHAVYEKETPNGVEQVPWAPNRHKIADFVDALRAIAHLNQVVDQPTWIDDADDPGGVIVACANGLLHVGTRTLHPHDPRFFNQTAVPFYYDPHAPAPGRWLQFLGELWPEDRDSIAALQEFFGYVISGRLDLQKILLLVGPTGGGKGATARVLGALVGPHNVAGPTLSSLSYDFGLAPLLGKPLAVISDARLDGKNSNVVVERLLSISGEDAITVNRKYRDQWTGKLPTRLFVISNELPRLGDASAAIAGRFVTLLLTRSWLGSEDPTLEAGLHAELTGILNWSLDGLDRLEQQGRFTRERSAISSTSPSPQWVPISRRPRRWRACESATSGRESPP
jgi:putative DNA primase/helicase